ncbi:MAG: hypothetical protein U9R19_16780 [Bacteroidota bacterium]|nr:hypothetical protein [Bacteroidota bacterium]
MASKVKSAFRNAFKHRCLKLFVAAYKKAMYDKSISLDWDENDITAQLHEYIDSNQSRLNWSIISNVEHHLPKKSIEKEKGFAAKYPRIDLRFATIKSNIEYQYFFEAKNLKEKSSALKRRYIDTGIDNFNSKKYENGCLIGYLLKGDVELTINGINSLLMKDNREKETLIKAECKYHDKHYESLHLNKECLDHYIFDFTILLN